MDTRILLAVVATLAIVSGCATMSAEDCGIADWRAVGYDDGKSGAAPAKAERRSNDCAKHGVAMDRSAYDAGRDEGLGVYCRESTGYLLGESGRAYNGVCVNHDESSFLNAYNRGREYRSFTVAVTTAADKRDAAQARHDELDRKLDKYWTGYRDEGLTTEEHNKMVLDLWAERKYLEKTAIPYWSRAHDSLESELGAYRHKVAANDPAIGTLQPTDFSGPRPYTGPTKADARAMLQEVFSSVSQANNGR